MTNSLKSSLLLKSISMTTLCIVDQLNLKGSRKFPRSQACY